MQRASRSGLWTATALALLLALFPGCAELLARALRSLPTVADARVSYTERRARVSFDVGSPPDDEAVRGVVGRLGYRLGITASGEAP